MAKPLALAAALLAIPAAAETAPTPAPYVTLSNAQVAFVHDVLDYLGKPQARWIAANFYDGESRCAIGGRPAITFENADRVRAYVTAWLPREARRRVLYLLHDVLDTMNGAAVCYELANE